MTFIFRSNFNSLFNVVGVRTLFAVIILGIGFITEYEKCKKITAVAK